MSYKLFELIPVLQNGDPASDFTVPVTVQGGGGTGGGPATIADGADVAEGTTTDAAVVTDANGTISAKLRGLVVILLRAFALSTPIRIDPVGSTAQPVSGTVTTTPPANASTNVAQVAGTATSVNSGNKDAGTQRVVLATDQPAVSVSGTVTTTPPSNASTNLAQVAGTTPDTNSGNKSAGTLRVVLATDQPQLTARLLVTPDSVALPAHQSVNVDQIAGTTPDTNSGNKSAGTLRVVLATDQPAVSVSGTVTTTPPSHASTNVDQIAGQAPALNAGTASAGTPRVVQATAAVLNVTQPSVLVSSTSVIAANANRIKVRIINTSTNPLWIGPTNPATVGNGAYIPGIAGYPWTTRYEGALYAIATGGTALVTVDEEASA